MKNFPKQTPHSIEGITLLELMVTIVVGAILMSIAVPSFNTLIQSNRLTAHANEFSTTANLARSEAIKRGQNMIIRSQSGTNWSDGWVLVSGSGETLRRTTAMDGTTTFTSNSTGTITYNPRGFTTLGAEESFTLCHADLTTGRRIRIAITGRISVLEISPCS